MGEPGYNRRRFLAGGLATLGMAAVGREVLPKAEAKEREPSSVRQRLHEKIEWAVKHTERLSRAEVRQELLKCTFIEPESIHFGELDVSIPQNQFAAVEETDRYPFDTATENIAQAVREKRVGLSKAGLTILETNLTRLGLVGFGAAYVQEFQVMLIPDSSPERIRHHFRQQLWFEAQRNGSMNEDETPGDVFDLSDEALKEQEAHIQAWLESEVERNVYQNMYTKEAITHEAGHYFLDRFFDTPDYAGPDVTDLFTLAVEQMNQRLLNNPRGMEEIFLPKFAQHIHGLFRDVNILDKAQVRRRCQTLIDILDGSLTHFVPMTVGEQKKLLPEEAEQYISKQFIVHYIGEYFARIYNAAAGYDLDATFREQQYAFESHGLDPNKVEPAYESFLNPTKEELAFVRDMVYKNKPII